VILGIAALGGCGGGGGGAPGAKNPPPPPPPSGGTQFTKMLILGGSTAAGYQSSGISGTTQRQTYGALLATMSGAPFAIPELAGSGCPAPVTTPLAAQNSAVNCSRAAALPATTTGQLAAVPQTRVGDALVVAAGNRAALDSRFDGKLVNNNCSPVNGLGQPNPLADNLVSMRILTDAAVPEINCDPAMTGPGSPYLLDPQEQAAITARVDQFNSAISGIATARNWVYLDPNAFLAPLRAETAAGRHDRLRKCQQLPGAATPAAIQNAVLSSCPASGATAAPNRFGSPSSYDALNPGAEFHRLLAVKMAIDINAKYATTVSTTPPP
jgi:hypothetical protein